jgi:hypothetical protein
MAEEGVGLGPDILSFFSNQLDTEVNTDHVQHVRNPGVGSPPALY